jgi:hypothetical protein
MRDSPDIFGAVYYSRAVPRNKAVLTFLGLIFDKIYFPGVYMPPVGFDEKAVEDEIQRIEKFGLRDPNTINLLDCMAFAIENKHLADLCVFPGRPGGFETFEQGVHEVADQLELMVFGPRPEGEIPVRSGPYIKGLPGSDEAKHQVSFPDTVTYPANALLFAARNGLPLVNDVEGLPVPGIGTADATANAKILATILTLESVSLVLPAIKPLEPVALHDLRKELAPQVKPFRLSMLRLAKDLNAAIVAGAPLAEIQKQAKFLVETEVYPKLAELEAVVKNPAKHWYNKAVDVAKAVPELAVNLAAIPANLAIAKFLAKIAVVLSQARDEQIAKEDQVAKTGLYYLLKLKDAAAR